MSYSNLIQQPYPIILNPHGGGGSAKPAANAEYHVGEIDKDPIQFPRTDLAYKDESGTERLITSPIYTNNSGAFVASKNSSTIIQPYMKDGVGYSVLIKGRRGEIYSSKRVGDPGNLSESIAKELPNYTDIVYKASDGKSAVENMVKGVPVYSKIGDKIQTEDMFWERISLENNDISDFKSVGDLSMLAFGYGAQGNTPEQNYERLVEINNWLANQNSVGTIKHPSNPVSFKTTIPSGTTKKLGDDIASLQSFVFDF